MFSDKELEQCYRIIRNFYGDKRAKRSGVPYMNHIDEGLVILDEIEASTVAKRAYCLHPVVQDDSDDLYGRISLLGGLSCQTICTVMEYRNVANRGLSCFQVDDPNHIYMSPLIDVRDMLVADKVQNRKDFLKYHFKTHPKSKELDRYFRNWLRALNVTEAEYDRLVEAITQCGECGGVGVVDSGGVTPEGNGIDVPCTCTPTVTAQDLFSRMKGKYWRHAQSLAESEGWAMRIVGVNGRSCIGTCDFVPNRINVTLVFDIVSEYRGVG